MRVVEHHNIRDFADRVRPMLVLCECENCWQLGAIDGLCRDEPRDNPLLLTIEDESGPFGLAMQIGKHSLGLTLMPSAVIDILIESLRSLAWLGPGVFGPTPTADRFAEQWCGIFGLGRKLLMHTRVFQLANVSSPRPAPGMLVSATMDQTDQLARWREEYAREIGEPISDAREGTIRLIESGRLFAWEDGGQYRAIGCIAGPTPNGIRINNVYTPPEFRNRGYASNLVAAISQRMLDSGKKLCFLFADVGNPTTNRIYERMGYCAMSECTNWEIQ